ncbi:hypothetical protein TWF481_007056 [Arthrobotrys musiformis]|uniref:Small RNA 2'-O-methyltransferase n=1 Tax=Arthrobotrys musiformis TaxID=47236 RepID=A0AAV9WBQ5_9PEZI
MQVSSRFINWSDGSTTPSGTRDTTNASTRFTQGVPSPPFDPPCIRFVPPLSIQRRAKIFELLKKTSMNYEGSIQSLLDVGCGGNTPLIQTLLSCDDELPLSLLSGIDIDSNLAPTGSLTAFTTLEYGGGDRWRELTVSLVHGSFENISPESIGPYDAIVSSEVIEHLDPGPLANFAPTLLGRMNPKVLIVTTPNRDFNSLFEMPYESVDFAMDKKPYVYNPSDDPLVSNRRYYRAPHTYGMRHDDHRFEWTRQEFQEWGDDAAETFGYTVQYHGCGALHDGAEILASRWRVEEALRKQIRSQNITLEEGQSMGTDLLLQVFGHCSQVAIFIRNDFRKKSQEEISSLESQLFLTKLTPMSPIIEDHIRLLRQLPPELQFIKYQTFTRPSFDQPYPPTIADLFGLQRLALKHLIPYEVQRIWEYRHQNLDSTHNIKYDYDAIVVKTDLKYLWENCYEVRRTCRYHFELFEHLMCINSESSFDFSGNRHSDGLLEFGLIDSSDPVHGPIGVIALGLEQVENSEPAYDPTEVPDFENSDDEFDYSPEKEEWKVVSKTPMITVNLYWYTDPSDLHLVSEDIYLAQDQLYDIPKERILTIHGPAESMRQLQERFKYPESYLPPAITSTPITLVFQRPEMPIDEAGDFDYEEERQKMLEPFGEGLNDGKSWVESPPGWGITQPIIWEDDPNAEVIDWGDN